jgi:hypothetical protein
MMYSNIIASSLCLILAAAVSSSVVSAFTTTTTTTTTSKTSLFFRSTTFTTPATTKLYQSSFVSEELTTVVAGTETSSSSKPKSYLDDGFVFGLEDSGLQRPKGKVSQVVVEGDSLTTTVGQRAVVWMTFLGHFGFIISSVLQINQMNHSPAITSVESFLLVLGSWLLADFGSGVLHWSVDNYGNGRTPIMGNIIAAFQGHHSARTYDS